MKKNLFLNPVLKLFKQIQKILLLIKFQKKHKINIHFQLNKYFVKRHRKFHHPLFSLVDKGKEHIQLISHLETDKKKIWANPL